MKGLSRAIAEPRVVLSVIATILLLLTTAGDAAGHAAFVESDPPPDAVLPEQPDRVRIRFSEPLEAAGSGAVLLAADGSEVAGVESAVDPDDPNALLVTLPDDLGDGAFAVSWRNLSAADGHGQRGFFAFTVGAASGASTAPIEEGGGIASVLAAIGRWLGAVGLAAQAVAWPLWLVVARPALATSGLVAAGSGRARRVARAGTAIGLLAAFLTLFVQGDAAQPGDPLGGAVALLSGSRWGWLWLARLAGIAVLAVLLERLDWERARALDPLSVVALVVGVAIPAPFAMNAHAAAVVGGEATAIAAQYVHLLGAALWFGGLAVLALVVAPAAWPAGDAVRRRVLAAALPRFSAASVAVWVMLAATGLYAAWLHVGSLPALLTPGYGLALLAKLLLLAPILVLAAISRWRFVPRIAAPERAAWDDRAPFVRGARRSIRWELLLAVPVFLLAAYMASSEPARDVLRTEQPAGRAIATPLTGGGPAAATLLVAPGVPGANAFTLDVAGPTLPADSEALLRVSLPARDMPQRTVPLTRANGNRFVGEDTLPATGDWDAEIVVRRIGAFNATANVTVPVSATPPVAADPAPPAPVFGPAGAVAVLLAAVALVGGAVASVLGPRRAGWPVGLAGAAVGAALLLAARVPPASAPILAAPGAPGAAVAPGANSALMHDHHQLATPMAGMDHATPHPAAPAAAPSLGEAQEVNGLRIVLAAGAAIDEFAVEVADAAGAPVDGASVSVSARPSAPRGDHSQTLSGRADPVSPGRYETAPLDLAAGSWRVTVRVSPRGEPSRSATWRVVAPGA